ncbi:MAG TPA: DUF881 domain-containing protein [Clostridiaceae bacterium]|nr:DUF881 domain-containing protein [Clostridiaceae bacterium]
MKHNAVRTTLMLLATVLLGLAVALSLKGVNQGSITTRNVQELQNQVIDYQKKNEELNARNFQLYEYIAYLESALEGDSDAQMKHLQEERERFAIFAGLRDVHNVGVVITLQETKLGRMRDSVLRQFVNELSALGAQAVSINGERKVATTEIRANGDEIIINGVVFDRASAFDIKAILEPSRLESYTLPYLESIRKQIANDLSEEQYVIEIRVEQDVLIPALSEERIAYSLDLLKPVE